MEMQKQKFYHRLNRYRKIVQISSLLFFMAIPLLCKSGIHLFLGTLYSLTIGKLSIADPLMVLQTLLLRREIYLPLLLAAVLPLVVALLLGRVFCSWVCPQNTLSEWIDGLEKRFFRKRWRQKHHYTLGKNPPAYHYWLIFSFLLLSMAILGFPLLAYLSAPGLITSFFSQAILGQGIGLEIFLVLFIFALEAVLFRRFWCKYGCPVGAFLALFRTRKTLSVQFRENYCDCKPGTTPCYTACPLHLAPKQVETLYPYCYNCGLCVSFCENAGRALSLGFGHSASSEAQEHRSGAAALKVLQVNRNR